MAKFRKRGTYLRDTDVLCMVAAAFPIELFMIGGVRHTFDVDTVFARKLRSVIF